MNGQSNLKIIHEFRNLTRVSEHKITQVTNRHNSSEMGSQFRVLTWPPLAKTPNGTVTHTLASCYTTYSSVNSDGHLGLCLYCFLLSNLNQVNPPLNIKTKHLDITIRASNSLDLRRQIILDSTRLEDPLTSCTVKLP